MALIRGWRFLDSARINTIVRTLADELEDRQRLIYLERTPVVNADDDEIVGKFKGQYVAADIIADDQEAVVYDTVGQFEFVATNIPNIKMGSRLSQKMIHKLARLRRNIGNNADTRFFTDWENTIAESLIKGIRSRVNAMICGMHLDAFTYDRFGIKMANVGWGMPSDLKVTPAQAWGNSNGTVNNSSTPITDLQVLLYETAPDVHGEEYNRVTMSSKTFRLLTANTEFQARISGELRYSFGANELNVRDAGMMRSLLANIVGVEIELYDGTYFEQNNAGTKTRKRVLPINKVILSNSNDDGDSSAMDLANGIVTESIAAEFAAAGGIGGEAYGPIAYFTGNRDLNPPDFRAWAVMRAFPRKHRETATAVITAGTYS